MQQCTCPHCGDVLFLKRRPEGLNYCTTCHNLFLVPPAPRVPAWILGVLLVLAANWQVLCR